MRLNKILFMMVLLTIAVRASSQVSFSVDPVSINAGGTQEVDIKVSITGSYKACQFDLLLPEGLSIASGEYGYLAKFVKLDDNAEDHGMAMSNPSANLYRFVISSTNNRTFGKGNNRSFVSLTLVADAKASLGTNAAKIQNALFSISNTQGEKPADLNFNITVAEKKGDANGDGVVDVADVVAVVNYILGKASGNFNKAAANINGDEYIDVADVVGIVNIILGKQYSR